MCRPLVAVAGPLRLCRWFPEERREQQRPLQGPGRSHDSWLHWSECRGWRRLDVSRAWCIFLSGCCVETRQDGGLLLWSVAHCCFLLVDPPEQTLTGTFWVIWLNLLLSQHAVFASSSSSAFPNCLSFISTGGGQRLSWKGEKMLETSLFNSGFGFQIQGVEY